MDPLKEMSKRANETANNNYRWFTPAYFLNGVLFSALLIMLLAIFNYISTSIAFSSKRLKEVGVRKTVGADRWQLIAQFLCEHAIICLIAIVLGLCAAEFLMKGINRLFSFVSLHLDLLHRSDLIAFIINRDLIVVLAIAIVMADVVGYFLVKWFLDSIWYYHVGVGPSAMLTANLLVAVIAILTVSWQVRRAATADPVASLRYE